VKIKQTKLRNVAEICEGCLVRRPKFGLPKVWPPREVEGKLARAARWCSGCAKGHAEAVDVVSKKCEDCQLKPPNFGLPADGKAGPTLEGRKRWCGGCAKGHAGALNIDLERRMCEDCGKKTRSHGLPLEAGEERTDRRSYGSAAKFEAATVPSPLVWGSI
jgi:hypothetical protein